jgi:hypothetical protein
MWTLEQSLDCSLLENKVGQAGIQLEAAFDANKELQRGQVIITLEPEALAMSPLVIPSHLRAMAELEKAVEKGALEGIDSVLGYDIFKKFLH